MRGKVVAYSHNHHWVVRAHYAPTTVTMERGAVHTITITHYQFCHLQKTWNFNKDNYFTSVNIGIPSQQSLG